ncbi:hypothetical protein HPB48_004072 [Haemaphysalis longicornis]|uniref:SKP1 component dimerisation domain-containing protein n=1 Tax=Haemaphysalis longicornis TaxID=44386 RepID=A0A9J6G7M1_HAELO|nr:hypothetical protein HPB48_004072 [Haemaphysalis longicornis]
MDVMCKSVADMIKGKKPEEIRKLLNLPNDLTPEDHEAMYNTRAWSEGWPAILPVHNSVEAKTLYWSRKSPTEIKTLPVS